ncbi:syndecan-3-like isoform X2 [Hypanus sabinus]|uniref:syndecan-3-like isoform X2 n=1 Tax=Hypanus sabinus TaxID=79690 RepID=UPI0028C47115|nr:syndecan-3-like isoform X2 [Hypanus sabinus]
MAKLSVLLLCLLIPSLCDIVSMYRTSRQTQDLATLTDLEGSGSDDEDEGFYSGSGGSGYPDFESELRFTPGVTRAVTVTPSTSAFSSVQPFAFTFRSTTLTSGGGTRAPAPTSAALATQQAATAAPAPATTPRVTTASTGAATTSTVQAPTARSSTVAVVPLATTVITATTKQSTTSLGDVARPISTPDPQTDRATLESFTAGTSKTILSAPYVTEKTSSSEQVEEVTINNEVEAPAAGSPSGDFEITEEVEVVNREANNEVFAAITQPTVRGTGKIDLPDIIDNAIDSGSSSSAAQLPQKNILERKEVLVAVVVGGVVGALFAAFLVMLLIYRMKKKDEGSYTLEEPKQASIAYQKPDKQEEFYA